MFVLGVGGVWTIIIVFYEQIKMYIHNVIFDNEKTESEWRPDSFNS